MKKQLEFISLYIFYLYSILGVVYGDSIPVVISEKEQHTLTCEDGNSTGITWQHNNESIDKSSIKSIIRNNNNTITISHADSGIYDTIFTCQKDSTTIKSYKIFPKPIPALKSNSVAVEGEKLKLHCEGNFYEDVILQWRKNHEQSEFSPNSSSGIRYEPDNKKIKKAYLIFNKTEISDAGSYSCFATYMVSNFSNASNATTTLRVKGKLAALWPFLGIVAEVVVLCTIILIYEKKRNKSELEESDTDQNPETKPAPNKDSDVRQRK